MTTTEEASARKMLKAHIDGFVSEIKECSERKGKIIREADHNGI